MSSPWKCFVVALVAGLSACAAEPVPVAAGRAPIINGTPLTGDLAIVALMVDDSSSYEAITCTGTLIAPHVVATAAHCLEFEGQPGPAYVYFGDDPRAGGDLRKVRRWVMHPGFTGVYTPDFRLDDDIGLVILEDEAPAGAVPYGLAHAAPTTGQPARFAGFGCREATGLCGPLGVKYATTTAITKVGRFDFDYGVATCNGDSGGPALVLEDGVEVLGGVTSTGDPKCDTFGVDTRVDAFAAWATRLVAGEDPSTCAGSDCPCAADGRCTVACGRPGNDPDCPADCGADGVCDVACPERDPDCPAPRAEGAACDDDSQCASRVCEGVCRPSCNPDAPMACTKGLSCEAGEFGDYACVSDSGGGCGCRVGGAEGAEGGQGAGRMVLVLAGLLVAAAVRRRTSPRR